MVMNICPKWEMDSAAELAVKNWYVRNKIAGPMAQWRVKFFITCPLVFWFR